MWGVEEIKADTKIFKLIHLELEPDKNNLLEPNLVNFHDFLLQKHKLKGEDEEPDSEKRETDNKEIT